MSSEYPISNQVNANSKLAKTYMSSFEGEKIIKIITDWGLVLAKEQLSRQYAL